MTVTANRVTGLNLDIVKEREVFTYPDAAALIFHVARTGGGITEVTIPFEDLRFYYTEVLKRRVRRSGKACPSCP